LATLKAMLKDNPDLVFTKYEGQTPLHWAAWWGHKDVAELLLANDADVNARKDTYGNSPDNGNTPLHTAVSAAASDYSWVKEGHKDVAELLLAHGADVNAENDHGWTPLYRAAGRNSAVAEFLRHHGGQVTTRVTTVEEAVRVGGLEKAKALLKESPGVVFSNDTFSNTPLHWAAKNGYKDVAELLLANAANVNASGDKGHTPLHWAAFRGHEDMAELLLAHGANVDAENADEWTPLHAAADAGHKSVVTLLLANGADVNAENNAGSTPLYLAVVEGHENVVELLHQHGAH
jgi:ankyrin repeat protein